MEKLDDSAKNIIDINSVCSSQNLIDAVRKEMKDESELEEFIPATLQAA